MNQRARAHAETIEKITRMRKVLFTRPKCAAAAAMLDREMNSNERIDVMAVFGKCRQASAAFQPPAAPKMLP